MSYGKKFIDPRTVKFNAEKIVSVEVYEKEEPKEINKEAIEKEKSKRKAIVEEQETINK